jgi:hypothetical protein
MRAIVVIVANVIDQKFFQMSLVHRWREGNAFDVEIVDYH